MSINEYSWARLIRFINVPPAACHTSKCRLMRTLCIINTWGLDPVLGLNLLHSGSASAEADVMDTDREHHNYTQLTVNWTDEWFPFDTMSWLLILSHKSLRTTVHMSYYCYSLEIASIMVCWLCIHHIFYCNYSYRRKSVMFRITWEWVNEDRILLTPEDEVKLQRWWLSGDLHQCQLAITYSKGWICLRMRAWERWYHLSAYSSSKTAEVSLHTSTIHIQTRSKPSSHYRILSPI